MQLSEPLHMGPETALSIVENLCVQTDRLLVEQKSADKVDAHCTKLLQLFFAEVAHL